MSTATTLVWITIIPHLDYCNLLPNRSPCSHSGAPHPRHFDSVETCQIMSSFYSTPFKGSPFHSE